MSREVVFAGRVIVKAVIFQSFVLQLNKMHRGPLGPDLYTTDSTQGSEGGSTEWEKHLPQELDSMVRAPYISHFKRAFLPYTIGGDQNPILR